MRKTAYAEMRKHSVRRNESTAYAEMRKHSVRRNESTAYAEMVQSLYAHD